MPSKKPKPQKFHRRIKRHHVHASLIVAVLAVAAGFFIHSSSHANTCLAPYAIASPQSGATVAGNVVLQAFRQSGTPNTSGMVRFQIIYPQQMILGPASTSDGNAFAMQWQSTSVPDGQYQLAVLDELGCLSPAITMVVKNTQPTNVQPEVITQITPTSWSGNTNVASPFTAIAKFRDPNGTFTDVSNAAQYHWTTSIGTISAGGRGATYYSGPTAGAGKVTVTATYNGITSMAQAGVTVYAYKPPVGDVSGTNTTPTSPSPAAPGTSPSSTTTPAQPISVPLDATTATCLQTALSQQKYQDIIEGKLAATPEQRLQAVKCFAPQFVIPARLAPVDPSAVQKLDTKEAKVLSVAKAETQTKDNKKSIRLSGKAALNTDVYLYVFSEPLVLKAKSDGEGNWDYSLENPLKPGDHKVYVVQQDSSGTFVRSDSFPIAVAQAESSGDNPEGNSLQLVSHNNTSLYWYLAVAALLLVFGIRLVFILRRNRRMISVA